MIEMSLTWLIFGFDPMKASLTSRLEALYTGVVHDVMREMGLPNFTVPKNIRPILPEKTLAGPVFTINGKIDRNADNHCMLLKWIELLSKPRSGYIWVCPNLNLKG